MFNIFKPYPTHFSKWNEKISRGLRPPCASPGRGPVLLSQKLRHYVNRGRTLNNIFNAD